MIITKLSTAVMEANFDWTIVKIETDEGITGYGEAFLAPGLPAVIQEYSIVIEGLDPTHLDRTIRRLRASCVHASPGMAWHAIGGIETALLDLVGKKYGLPVWQILGGKYRDEVRIYADCHAGDALESLGPLVNPRTPNWMKKPGDTPEHDTPVRSLIDIKHHGWDANKKEHLTPDSFGARAQQMAQRGFTMLKFDVDVPKPFETDEYNRDLSAAEVDYAVELATAVRQAVGRDVGLALDCHWNYGVQAAIELARALEPLRLLWLEDPTPPENIRAIGEVQRHTKTPVATGENHYFRLDFQHLMVDAGLRVLAPDVQKLGLWEGRKLADLADMHYVNLTWHNISSPLGTMAGVHLGAATPNFLALEWHAASVPFFDELIKGGTEPMVRNGKVAVPNKPGLGIELDEDVMYRYRKPGERFFGQ